MTLPRTQEEYETIIQGFYPRVFVFTGVGVALLSLFYLSLSDQHRILCATAAIYSLSHVLYVYLLWRREVAKAYQEMRDVVAASGIYDFPKRYQLHDVLVDKIVNGDIAGVIRVFDEECEREGVVVALSKMLSPYRMNTGTLASSFDPYRLIFGGPYKCPIMDYFSDRGMDSIYKSNQVLMNDLWKHSNASQRRYWRKVVSLDMDSHVIFWVFKKQDFHDFVSRRHN